jgi:hypothetical protein
VRLAAEAKNGMLGQALKDRLFNTPLTTSITEDEAQAAARGVL